MALSRESSAILRMKKTKLPKPWTTSNKNGKGQTLQSTMLDFTYILSVAFYNNRDLHGFPK